MQQVNSGDTSQPAQLQQYPGQILQPGSSDGG